MPIHHWSRVHAAVFHDFHHGWIDQIKRLLNNGLLPSVYYAMVEQHAAHFDPDVMTLQSRSFDEPDDDEERAPFGDRFRFRDRGPIVSGPNVRLVGETDMESYRRKQNVVAVRHASDDRLVAIVEIVSPGHKSSDAGLRKFVDKVVELLSQGIHLLIVDLMPPTRRDPDGIHGAIWEALIDDDEYKAPVGKPLALAAYEAEASVCAFVEPVAIGDMQAAMPLFLEACRFVLVDLESTYESAWQAVPLRWRSVIEG
jgi:Protein of unknown function (DUF4058)